MRDSTSRTLLPFVLLVLLGTTWALSMPIGSAPDEPSHVRRSASVARGNLKDDATRSLVAVRLPAYFDFVPCYSHIPDDASCMVIPEGKRDRPMIHSASNYPPLYHAIAGAPTLFVGGVTGLYLMRLGPILIGALLVVAAASRIQRLASPAPALIGYAAALTPMAVFLLGTVNPSGLAITAGIAAWGWGHHLVRTAPLDRLQIAALGTGTAMCAQLLTRRDSVLWVGATIALLALITPRDRWAGLLKARPVHLLGVALLAATAIQLWYSTSTLGGIAEKSGDENIDIDLGWARGQLAVIYREMIGILGWLDTEIPFFSQVIIGVVLVGLVATAIARAPRRIAVAVGLAIAVTAGFILAFDAARPGYIQGRYLLPFAVGVPLLSGLGLAEVGFRIRREVTAAVLGLLALAQFGAFHAALSRFSAGRDAPIWFFGEVGWNPPAAPVAVMLVLNALIAAALAVALVRTIPDGHAVSTGPSARRGRPGAPTRSSDRRATSTILPSPADTDWLTEGLRRRDDPGQDDATSG